MRDDQVRRITLNPVAGTDLNALLVGSTYQSEDIEPGLLSWNLESSPVTAAVFSEIQHAGLFASHMQP